jgi:hypothetical protein
MRGQPNRGLRWFISAIAQMTSLDGPLAPGFLLSRAEYRSRYFRFFIALWKLSRVEGLMRIAHLAMDLGFTK